MVRLTKNYLKNARIRFTKTVNDVFKLDDDELRSYIGSTMPGVRIDETNREELLRWAVHSILDDCFPDRL
jgi:hypothetical protein